MSNQNFPPSGDGPIGFKILRGLFRDRSLLTALTLMHKYVGNAFTIPIPGFKPAVFVGPKTNRQILVSERQKVLWRNENDPVTKLLQHGVLVVDGAEHDTLRTTMEPVLLRKHVLSHIPSFWKYTDQVTFDWHTRDILDMLVEMRKLALLILFGSLFNVDFTNDLDRLWQPIIDLIKYISPGYWILSPKLSRDRKYNQAQESIDEYLHNLIRQRRSEMNSTNGDIQPTDLLSTLVSKTDFNDELIRDQLLTMLIAGHDTSTALLAWTLYLLGSHPDVLNKVKDEIDSVVGASDNPPSVEQINQLVFTDQVIKEALRLYPPIHVGNRSVAEDMNLLGYHVPKNSRIMLSIFLSHHDPELWPDPDEFRPERFAHGSGENPPAFTYLPFGGGPRNCIGAAFAQIESKVVLARIVQQFHLVLLNKDDVKPHMGATLEPHPGVLMRVHRRSDHIEYF